MTDARREIISLIDEHWNPWVKAAYYSDPEVARIMDRITREWSNNNERGRPIDYATNEELALLLAKARWYYRLDPRTAMGIAMRNMSRQYEDTEDEKGAGLLGVFRKLFAPSRDRQGASP